MPAGSGRRLGIVVAIAGLLALTATRLVSWQDSEPGSTASTSRRPAPSGPTSLW
jgi:hypothetical protein